MRTVRECNVQVAEMVRLAAASPTETGRTEFLKLADEWRQIAIMAAWQDIPLTSPFH
jgi:hypothetical protein